uniref:Uncharacterized protein n=1 Tax=Attheya septentrionalis TaxID=420275 RepID=A0A7S2XKJ8_9STRA|mmetsp:Transcript_15861/g.28858  ORF Transcript_15861/g.28858 Transcript_15861/m.28858 type:complete len:276 (+) Transcript_15861:203-1030(+)
MMAVEIKATREQVEMTDWNIGEPVESSAGEDGDDKLVDAKERAEMEMMLEEEKQMGFWDKIWYGAAGGSAVMQCVSMAWHRSLVTYVAGAVGLLCAPAVAVSQRKLQSTDSLRKYQNLLRGDVNRLMHANDKLTANVDELEVQVGGLQETEQKLDEITKEQGTNTAHLIELINENQTILNKMNANIKGVAMEQLVSVVLRSDRDEDFSIEGTEIRRLQLRLSNIPGIVVNEERFIAKLEKDGSLGGIMQVIRTIEIDDLPEEERIFMIDESQLKK